MYNPEKNVESSSENKKLQALKILRMELNSIYVPVHSQENKIRDYDRAFGQGAFAKLEELYWAIQEVESIRDTSKIDELAERCKHFWQEIEPKINIKENIPKLDDRDLKDAFDGFFKDLDEFLENKNLSRSEEI